MKASQNGLMNQIRRVLFQESEAEQENLSSLQGGSLANLTINNNTVKPKSRRGQRQKWNRQSSLRVKESTSKRSSGSILAGIDNVSVLTQTTSRRGRMSGQGMSVLADINTESSLVQATSRMKQKNAFANSISVLAGNHDDDESIASYSSRRRNKQNANESNQGLMSLFGISEVKTRKKEAKRGNDDADITALGGLLGAIGIQDDVERKIGKRGRRQAKKRVSWANESSLVPKDSTLNTSVMVNDPGSREQRYARRVGQSVDLGTSLTTSSCDEDANEWPTATDQTGGRRRKKTEAKPFSIMTDYNETVPRETAKPTKRKNVRMRSKAKPIVSTTPEKGSSDDDIVMATVNSPDIDVEAVIPDSATKPTKRMDTRPTPEKLGDDDDDDCMADEGIPESPTLSATWPSTYESIQDEDQVKPQHAMGFSSRVLEEEYVSPSVAASVYGPSPVPEIAEPETNEEEPSLPRSIASDLHPSQDNSSAIRGKEMRRSRRRPIPTDKYSPSRAMKNAQVQTMKPANKSKEVPVMTASIPLSSPTPMETDDDVEPIKRRSARGQVPIDRFSPSVTMKQAQSKTEDHSKDTSYKQTKSMLKKKEMTNGRPPKGKSNPSTEPQELPEQENYYSSTEGTIHSKKDSLEPQHSHSILSENTSDDSPSEEWSEAQLLQLQQSHAEVEPTSTSFWADIAHRVHGKTAQDCRDKWFSLVKTPAPRARKAAREDANKDLPFTATEAAHSNDEDDIFNSTPLRGTLFSNSDKSFMESEKEIDIDFDVGSPVMISTKPNRRVSTEYDDGNQSRAFQQKVGYKSYMLGLKRGVARALQEKKSVKTKKGLSTRDEVRTLTESVGDRDVSLKGQLSPGGTLQVKNLTEAEDDFLDYFSEPSDDEE